MEIVDFFFPKRCLGCGREGRYLCKECIRKIPFAQPICPYCKHPSIDGATHTNCVRKLGIDGLTSVWEYEGIIRKSILALKFKYATEIGKEISDYLISSLSRIVLPDVHFLTPIPIYWYKENLRGFNQSAELGKSVSQAMNWEFVPDLLIKNKPTPSQVELPRDARRKNPIGSFLLNPIRKSLILNLDSVFLFDDVFTTGSTLFEAAKVLKRAGARKVLGLTVAR